MKKYLILAAITSTVITSPIPDVQSAAEQQQQQQQWGDEPSPFLLSTVPIDQLIASSNSQNGAEIGFDPTTNAVEPSMSMPFVMDLHQIAVGPGGGRILPPSIIQSNEVVVNPITSFDVALPDLFSSSTIPVTDPGLSTEAISSESPGGGSDSSNKGTAPAAGSSSSPPPATAPTSELPLAPAPGSKNLDQEAFLDMDSLFDTNGDI